MIWVCVVMDAELKYLPLEVLSVDRTSVDGGRLQRHIVEYEATGQLPLVYVTAQGQLKRYRVKGEAEAVVAAQHLQLTAVWVLVLPAGPLPFMLPGQAQRVVSSDVPHVINAQAKDKLEEAQTFLSAVSGGSSQQAVAKQFGVSRSYVNNALQLTKLGTDAEAAFLRGAITASQARILSYEKDEDRQAKLLTWLISEQVSARALERAIYAKTDIKTETLQLAHLSRGLSNRWGCPTHLKMDEQGLVVLANPLKAQLATIIADVSVLDIVSELSWQEQGHAAQTAITFRVSDNAAFSAWIENLRLTDTHDLGVGVDGFSVDELSP